MSRYGNDKGLATGFIRGIMTDMRLFDTHCHPQFPQYDADRDQVIRRALDAGIGMVCVGTDFGTSKSAIELADRYEGLYASVGLHPNDNLEEEYRQDSYLGLVTHPKVVAIGEIGLDYYRTKDDAKKAFQKKRFSEQLQLSRSSGKPVIIHCREAHTDMISMLKGSAIRGVIHSFNGTIEQAAAYIEEGLYIGLNAIVTYASEYKDMVRSLPLDHILLETDAPYLAPAPYRGKRNEPALVDIVGRAIAEIKGLESQHLFSATTANAASLLGI